MALISLSSICLSVMAVGCVKGARNHMRWVFLRLFNLTIFTFMAPLIQMGVNFSSKSDVIKRVRECDALIDLNLELLRGIPVSVSSALIGQKPKVLVIHKLFWSFRILQSLWFLLAVKGIFKEKTYCWSSVIWSLR